MSDESTSIVRCNILYMNVPIRSREYCLLSASHFKERTVGDRCSYDSHIIVVVLRHTQYLKAALYSTNVSFGTNEV